MTNQWAIHDERKHGAALCWICNRNEANSGEHKTKRSDLAAVLRAQTQGQPLYFHDLEQRNKPIRSFDAKILKAPVRICHECNTSRTQPHDRAWERMSDELRRRDLAIGRWVRANGIFRYDTRLQMINVHLFFLKLFGCMLCEAKANGYDVPIDIALFSQAIMTSRPHPEVHLQFGKCDGTVGRSNLECFESDQGGVLAYWIYQLDKHRRWPVVRAGREVESIVPIYGPQSQTSSKRLQMAAFTHSRHVSADG